MPLKYRIMTNYKHIVIILLFLFFKPGLFSQDIFIKGVVISEDSTPVQYATIYDGSLKSGTFSDSLGRFSINMPGSVKELHISAIGYKNKTISVDQNDNLSDFNIVLLNDTFYLKEVVISSKIFKHKQIKLGPRKKIKGHISFCSQFKFNREVGIYIPNKEQIHGEIKSVEFFLKKESNDTKRLIRLRVYSVGKGLYPAKDLLLDNVLLQVKKSKKYQLIKIDLEKYNIPIPSNGIVIALELVQNTKEAYPDNLNDKNTRTDNCSFFEIVLVNNNTNSFVQWDRQDKGKWHNIDFAYLAKKRGFKASNLVPYVKLTINEYADRK